MGNVSESSSVTRLGDLFDFGQIFEACGKTISLPKSLTFLVIFCKGVKIFIFS